MASGDALFQLDPDSGMPPVGNAATLNSVSAVVTTDDNSLVRVLAFDGGSTDEFMDWRVVLPDSYAGTTGLTFTFIWSAATATSGEVVWGISIRRVDDDAHDLDTTFAYAYNESGAVTAPNLLNEVGYDDITFTDGTDMDDWAVGEMAIIRVRREASDTTNDDMAGDAYLHSIYCKET